MSTVWDHKTNKGRVVYDRKPGPFNERDIERIVRAFTEREEMDQVPMMSQLADRVLYWIAQRLSLDRVAGWAANIVVRIFESVRGMAPLPPPRGRRSNARFVNLFEVYPEPPAENPRLVGLLRLQTELESMLVWIKEETGTE